VPSIKITEEMQEAFDDEGCEDIGFELVEEGEWVNNYKDYDLKEVIYKHLESGKFYAYYDSRSGAHYSHYEYDSPDELVEVQPVETKTITYMVVK
jgi:hypothetical protein